MGSSNVDLVVVGSVGVDTIETPYAKCVDILGGSASYACAAAVSYTTVGMVGVVGTDFPEAHEDCYASLGINLEGLQKKEGNTFRWSGLYKNNMDERVTLSTELNVFADFSPELPPSYRQAPFIFLANIGPDLQLRVLDQIDRPRFVVMDTMDLWINIQREKLMEVIGRVDLLTLNESEARRLSGEHFLPVAANVLLDCGPKYVLIKKGEHGSMLFWKDGVFALPAYPLGNVIDPTGAGDAFAGGFMGSLAGCSNLDLDSLRTAMLHGSVTASFAVESFSLDRLKLISSEDIERRLAVYREILRLPD